jgi:hypothetical protein
MSRGAEEAARKYRIGSTAARPVSWLFGRA